jgi:hypothetical protein
MKGIGRDWEFQPQFWKGLGISTPLKKHLNAKIPQATQYLEDHHIIL